MDPGAKGAARIVSLFLLFLQVLVMMSIVVLPGRYGYGGFCWSRSPLAALHLPYHYRHCISYTEHL